MVASIQRREYWVTGFLVAMTLCNVTLLARLSPSLRSGHQDFTIYYTAARLLRSGQGSALYDLSAQYREQEVFAKVPIRHGPLPYNHPPFEAVLFVPFTLLSFFWAYLLWTALNLIMLAASIILLRKYFPHFGNISPLVLGLGATAFFPVAIGIIQGQDIIVLLLLFEMAAICLQRGNDAAAGFFLAAGLFRPHLVIPFVVLLAIRRWRILAGFAPMAALLGIVSVVVVGVKGFYNYIWFVLKVEKTGAVGFHSRVVPNLRGLLENIPGLGAANPFSTVLVIASSVVVFLMALGRIRRGGDSITFSLGLAIVTTLLISFHALGYDLCLLLPMLLFLLSFAIRGERKGIRWTILAALLLLSPLYIFLIYTVDSFFWFALVLLGLYLSLMMTRSPVLL